VAVAVGYGGPDLNFTTSPNPSTGQTQLAFALGKGQPVQLTIYDLKGRRIRALVDGELTEGRHVRGWDGRDQQGRAQPGGIYLVVLNAGGETFRSRLTLIR